MLTQKVSTTTVQEMTRKNSASILLDPFLRLYNDILHNHKGKRLFKTVEVEVKKRSEDYFGQKYGERVGPTGRMRLSKLQPVWWFAAVQEYLSMGSALVLSLVMSKIVDWRNGRKVCHRMDFSYVTNAMSVQFANDNREVMHVNLGKCYNITSEALHAVAHFCHKATKVEMFRSNLTGK